MTRPSEIQPSDFNKWFKAECERADKQHEEMRREINRLRHQDTKIRFICQILMEFDINIYHLSPNFLLEIKTLIVSFYEIEAVNNLGELFYQKYPEIAQELQARFEEGFKPYWNFKKVNSRNLNV